MPADEQLRQAFTAEAEQASLPPDLLVRIHGELDQPAAVAPRPWWRRVRLGAAVEVAILCLVIGGVILLVAGQRDRRSTQEPEPEPDRIEQKWFIDTPPPGEVPSDPVQAMIQRHERWRRELAGRPLPEQIAVVQGLTPEMERFEADTRACYARAAEPCPSPIYTLGDLAAIAEVLGQAPLLPTDPTLQLFAARHILFDPRMTDDGRMMQRAVLTWYRAEPSTTVVTISIGFAPEERDLPAEIGGLEAKLADGTTAYYRAATIAGDIAGAPFPYPWQEYESYLTFVKGRLLYQISAANMYKPDLVELANGMR